MFTNRGVILALTLIISPWETAKAQEAPIESPTDNFQPTTPTTLGNEVPPDVNPEHPQVVTGNNDPNFLESVGMTLEEFAKTNPSEEQINQLSEADRHDFENADITYSVTYNEPLTTNEGEQAQSDQFMNEDAGPKNASLEDLRCAQPTASALYIINVSISNFVSRESALLS